MEATLDVTYVSTSKYVIGENTYYKLNYLTNDTNPRSLYVGEPITMKSTSARLEDNEIASLISGTEYKFTVTIEEYGDKLKKYVTGVK